MTHNKSSLSSAVGISPSFLTHWLQGRRRMKPSTVSRIAEILDLPVECLVMPAGRPMVEARLRQRRPKALTRDEYNRIHRARAKEQRERLEYLEELLKTVKGGI